MRIHTFPIISDCSLPASGLLPGVAIVRVNCAKLATGHENSRNFALSSRAGLQEGAGAVAPPLLPSHRKTEIKLKNLCILPQNALRYICPVIS